MEDMAMLTDVADAYYFQSSHQIPDAITTLLMNARNEIQHELLSGPTSQLDKHAFSSTDRSSRAPGQIEALRLAASMYSDMVLYPLANSTGVKPRLASRLRAVLETSKINDATTTTTDPASQSPSPMTDKLSVWILWSGCLAAWKSADQDWFEDRLRTRLESMYGPDGFAELDLEHVQARILDGFLYWAPIYEVPNRELWARIRGRS
jgi:hypothetical protein